MSQHTVAAVHVVAEDGEATATAAVQAKRMDEAAFQLLYQKVAPRLRSYILRASGDRDLADDILQETFYRFLRGKLPALEEPQMKTYLYRTATSLIVNHWRRAKREQRWSLRTVFPRATPATKGFGSDLNRLFGQLKPQQRALLWLAYVEGFDHREIASTLGLKEKSIRVLLFRARNKLAGILKKEGLVPETKS